VLAILDKGEVPTVGEFRLVAARARKHGLDTLIGTLDEVGYDGSRVTVGGRAVDLVYRRALVEDLDDGHVVPRSATVASSSSTTPPPPSPIARSCSPCFRSRLRSSAHRVRA